MNRVLKTNATTVKNVSTAQEFVMQILTAVVIPRLHVHMANVSIVTPIVMDFQAIGTITTTMTMEHQI